MVYSPDQVKLKYVVQFSLEGDKLKEFTPSINMLAELALPSADQGEYCRISFRINGPVNFDPALTAPSMLTSSLLSTSHTGVDPL